jgi:hypothetical protein
VNALKILALILCSITVARPLQACACASRPLSDRDAAAESFELAQAVFTGEVIAVQPLSDENHDGFGPAAFSFKILQSFKGPRSPTISVISVLEGTDCAFALKPGDRLFVYAFAGKDGKLYLESCGRTSFLDSDSAGPDLRFALHQAPDPADLVPSDERSRLALDPKLQTTGATIIGRVHWPDKATHGDVFVTVWEVDDEGRPLETNRGIQKVEIDGTFTIRYVEPGNSLITADDSGFATAARHVGTIGPVYIPEKATVMGQDIELHARPLGTVTIHVTGSSLLPNKLFVVLRDVDLDQDPPIWSPFAFGTQADVDASGNAVFAQIPWGTYDVSVGIYGDNAMAPSWTHEDAIVTLRGSAADLSVRMHKRATN